MIHKDSIYVSVINSFDTGIEKITSEHMLLLYSNILKHINNKYIITESIHRLI